MGHQEHPSRWFNRGCLSGQVVAFRHGQRPAGCFGVEPGRGDQLRRRHVLAPWTGFAVMCPHAAVLIGVAAWRLRSTDA